MRILDLAIMGISVFASLGINFNLANAENKQIQPRRPIQSRINLVDGWIRAADISISDPLSSCPLETLPLNLQGAIEELVKRVDRSLVLLNQAENGDCKTLQEKLEKSQTIATHSLDLLVVLLPKNPSEMSQSEINKMTAAANQIHDIIQTATEIQGKCITQPDQWTLVQQAVAHLMSMSSLFANGWPSFLLNQGGWLLERIPIFQTELEKALDYLQEENKEEVQKSLLCLYRDMQKTSCLLFSTPADKMVHGVDMTYQSGPARITEESLNNYKANSESRSLLDGVVLLNEINRISQPFISEVSKDNELKTKSIAAFNDLTHFCRKFPKTDFEFSYPAFQNVQESFQALKQICQGKLDPVKYPLEKILSDAYWSLISLKNQYELIRTGENKELRELSGTWESHLFFVTLKESIQSYQDTSKGNLDRLNFRQLTTSLGSSIVDESFNNSMWRYRSIVRNLELLDRIPSSLAIRSRALKSMVDLCQTLDPTLVCLYTGRLSQYPLYQSWAENCAGQNSLLCMGISEAEENLLLGDDRSYQVYFDSLCRESHSDRSIGSQRYNQY